MCAKQVLEKAQKYGMSLIWPETEAIICAKMYCADINIASISAHLQR